MWYKWFEKYLPQIQRYLGRPTHWPQPYVLVREPYEDCGPSYDPIFNKITMPREEYVGPNAYTTIMSQFGSPNLILPAFALAHEYQHFVQASTGQMSYFVENDKEYVTWEGVTHRLLDPRFALGDDNYKAYIDQPWEVDANTKAIDFCKTFNYTW